jgi:hypothetical protein
MMFDRLRSKANNQTAMRNANEFFFFSFLFYVREQNRDEELAYWNEERNVLMMEYIMMDRLLC